MSAVEALDRSRRRMLLGALIGFTLWQGTWIASGLLAPGAVARRAQLVLVLVGLIAWAYWTINLVRMLRWQRHVSADDALAASLNDERIQQARLRAFSLAFVATMGTQAILLTATILATPISALLAAQVTILVGCVAAIGGFLFFERE